jgi:subtilisin family serine protease
LKKISPFLLALALVLCPISAYPRAQHTLRYAPGEILVKFKQGLSKEYTRDIYRSLGFKSAEGLKRMPIERIKLPAGWSVEEAVSFYRADPDVEYAEPNYIRRASLTPHDPYFPHLWGLHNTGQTGGTEDADIDAPEAWDIQRHCTGIVIAVLDTGADLVHEDLKENIWKNPGEDWPNGSPGNDGEDNDGNGKIDDYWGWDFVNNDNDPDDDNSIGDYYHGTHVTGIIAARGNNGVGITGVCWSASVMILKILDEDGIGDVAEELAAIEYAIDKGAKIINLSLGGEDFSQSEYEAIETARNAGVLVIAAAGNESMDNDETPVYPASYDLENIISVTATDQDDGLPAWANYGLVSVDVAAPGVAIYSTRAVNSYQHLSGSSMAVPHVAGLAALIWANYGGLTSAQVRAGILNGVDPASSLEGKTLTGGRINAYKSLIYFAGGGDDHPCFIAATVY